MNLSKAQRASLHGKYGGHCAYCGIPLTAKWQADHIEPVQRIGMWVSNGRRMKHVPTGEMNYPERDHIGNLAPSCVPCNNDKADSSVDSWRRRLEESHARLLRNYSTYKHALRFGLIQQSKAKVVFFFETYGSRRPLPKELRNEQ